MSKRTRGLFVPLARSSERQWYRDAEKRDGFHDGDLNAFRSMFRELAMAEEALAVRDQEIQDEYQLRTQRVEAAFHTVRSTAAQLRQQLKQKELDLLQLLISDDILNQPLPSLPATTPLTTEWIDATDAHWHKFAAKLSTLFSIIAANPELSSSSQAAMRDTQRIFNRSMSEWKTSYAEFRNETSTWTSTQLETQRVVCPVSASKTRQQQTAILPAKEDTNRDIRATIASLHDPTIELSVLDRIAYLYRRPDDTAVAPTLTSTDASTWDLAQRCLAAKLNLQQAEVSVRRRVRGIATSLRMGRNRVLEYLVQSISDAIQELMNQLQKQQSTGGGAATGASLGRARDVLLEEAEAQRNSYEQAVRTLGEKAKRAFDQYRVVNRLVRDLKWPLQTSPTFARELVERKFPLHEYGQFRNETRKCHSGSLEKHQQMAVRMMLQPARVAPEFRGVATLWSSSDAQYASMLASLIALSWQKYTRFRRHHPQHAIQIDSAPKFSRLHVLILTLGLERIAPVARELEYWLLNRDQMASWSIADGDASDTKPYLWVELPGAFHIVIHSSTHACSGNVLNLAAPLEMAGEIRPNIADWRGHVGTLNEVDSVTDAPLIRVPDAQQLIEQAREAVPVPVRLPVDPFWQRPLSVIVLNATGMVDAAQSHPADKQTRAAFSWAAQLQRHHAFHSDVDNARASNGSPPSSLAPASWLQSVTHQLTLNRLQSSRIRILLRCLTMPSSAAQGATLLRALSLVVPNSRCLELSQRRQMLPWFPPVPATWTRELRALWTAAETHWLSNPGKHQQLFASSGYSGVLSVVDMEADASVFPQLHNVAPPFHSLQQQILPRALKTAPVMLRAFQDADRSDIYFELRKSSDPTGLEAHMTPIRMTTRALLLPALVKCIQELQLQRHMVLGLEDTDHTSAELARLLQLPCMGVPDIIDAVCETFQQHDTRVLKYKTPGRGLQAQVKQIARTLLRHSEKLRDAKGCVLDLCMGCDDDRACTAALDKLIQAVGGKIDLGIARKQGTTSAQWYEPASVHFLASGADTRWTQAWKSLLGTGGEAAKLDFWRALVSELHGATIKTPRNSILTCKRIHAEVAASKYTHVVQCPLDERECWRLCHGAVPGCSSTTTQVFVYLQEVDGDALRWRELTQAYATAYKSAQVWKRALLESSYDCPLLQDYHGSTHLQYQCVTGGSPQTWHASWQQDTLRVTHMDNADWINVRCLGWKPTHLPLPATVSSQYQEADAIVQSVFQWKESDLQRVELEGGLVQCDDPWTTELLLALVQSDADKIIELLESRKGERSIPPVPFQPFQALIGRRLTQTIPNVILRCNDLASARLMWSIRRQQFLDRKLALQERLQKMDWLKPDDPDSKWAYLNPVTRRRVSSRVIDQWNVETVNSSPLPQASRAPAPSSSSQRTVHPLPADVSNEAFMVLSSLDRKLSSKDRKTVNWIKHAYEAHPNIALFGENPFQAGPVNVQTQRAREALTDIRRRYGMAMP